jgi:hypothetical protein
MIADSRLMLETIRAPVVGMDECQTRVIPLFARP